MKSETISFLCNPYNHEPLQLESEREANGNVQQWLVGVGSGQRFLIRDGIPVFFSEETVTGTNQKYQRLYDRIARWYDITEKIGAALARAGRDKVRRQVVEDIQANSGDHVLEVSIGTGINLRYLPNDANYFGLDISLGMLKQCQRNLRKWNLQAELFQGMAENLPFNDSVFDVVFHFGGINYFNDKARAIAEMIRVAKPGTKIFIGDETKDLAKQYEKLPGFNRFYRSGEAFTPLSLVPTEMMDIKEKRIWKNRIYMLNFRKP